MNLFFCISRSDNTYCGNKLINVGDASSVNEGYQFDDGSTTGNATWNDLNSWEY